MKPLHCILGFHDDTEVEVNWPVYQKMCKICGTKWIGFPNERWRKV